MACFFACPPDRGAERAVDNDHDVVEVDVGVGVVAKDDAKNELALLESHHTATVVVVMDPSLILMMERERMFFLL